MAGRRATGTLTIDKRWRQCLAVLSVRTSLPRERAREDRGEEGWSSMPRLEDGLPYQFDPARESSRLEEGPSRGSPAELIAASESRPRSSCCRRSNRGFDMARIRRPAYSSPDTYAPGLRRAFPRRSRSPRMRFASNASCARGRPPIHTPPLRPSRSLLRCLNSSQPRPPRRRGRCRTSPLPEAAVPTSRPPSRPDNPGGRLPSPDRPVTAPPAGAASSGLPAVRVYPTPGGPGALRGLEEAAFVDFPRLLRTLRSDRHTGYVNLSGNGYSGVILPQRRAGASRPLCSNGDRRPGRGRIPADPQGTWMPETGSSDVIELEGEGQWTALRRSCFTSPYLYSGLARAICSTLKALLEYLAEEHVSGLGRGANPPPRQGSSCFAMADILGTYTEIPAVARQGDPPRWLRSPTDRQSVIEVKGGGRQHRGHRRPTPALNRAY